MRLNFLIFVALVVGFGLTGCENKDLSAPGPDKQIQIDDSPRPMSKAEPAAEVQHVAKTDQAPSGLKTAVLSVPGMTCGSCPEIVKEIIAKMDGVQKVGTDQKTLTATVQFDPKKTDANKIAEQLGKANSHYKATIKAS
ncbi:MAG: cation transporter [Fimbriimonadaceae bacterium]|nr:cation transporter [Fimbriimonadaceae bacterium]QYK58591.1 MAG: cation transporter [Fimbriimonadaceae bacterium]